MPLPRLAPWITGACLFLTVPRVQAQPAPADLDPDVQALAERIDRHLADGWQKAKVTPAAPADDAEFLRRVSLDLAGRIPSVAEARRFLADSRPDRRRRLVDGLLASPRHITHFTRFWRALWLPEAGANFETTFVVPGFEAWLRKQLAADRGYDAIVRDLIAMPIRPAGETQRALMMPGSAEPTPVGFYVAKEVRPENLGAATARLFLGIGLDCAQCHDQPCGDWKREHFWRFAAFFAPLEASGTSLRVPVAETPELRRLTIPGTPKVVEATFLDGRKPVWREGASPRAVLAQWVTAADNPYFARATVNRVWAYLFGTGLAEPVDEMFDGGNPPSHPELLDELARALTTRRFDLKFLMRAITASRAYQLSSTGGTGKDDPRQFARARVRGLTPEQIYDSVAQATGYPEDGQSGPVALFGAGPSPRAEFLSRFASHAEKPAEPQTSIIHALTLMNGKLVADATSLEKSETLAAVVDAPFLDTAGRIEALYLATLSRRPRPAETERLVRYVEGRGAAGRSRALADVLWALLNSGEFLLNH